MTFIDPATGLPDTVGIRTLSGFIRAGYNIQGNNLNTFVEAAVSESPLIPEPGTLILLITGLPGVAWLRIRRRR